MKYLLIIAAVTTLSGCGDSGSPACDNSPIVNSWKLQGGDVFTVKSDCSWNELACGQSGTVSNVSDTSGRMNIVIESQSEAVDSNCKGAGKYTCSYAITGSDLTGRLLTFNCN